ncbi:MAG TPA: thiamine pyrophosphate-dependent enzyme [Burkholderiales bacterium]|jgi:thiamine pyrophosphate-dependent acetolactate synthase large subunit-like protein|nr:thiamine pyrophosphate-dependent enzyme [Burkholderiales bacterium]
MAAMASKGKSKALDRREVVRTLLAGRGKLLVIAGLGAPAWDATDAGDHPLTFPLWGGMGGAAAIGLGLALTQADRRVLVLTGDGELLMGMGSLATIGAQRPRNLSVVVLDNERYGETGMQVSHTAFGVDLAAAAKACGFVSATMVTTIDQVSRLRADLHRAVGPLFAQVKVAPHKLPLVLPPRDGAHLKDRFREALLGKGAYFQR